MCATWAVGGVGDEERKDGDEDGDKDEFSPQRAHSWYLSFFGMALLADLDPRVCFLAPVCFPRMFSAVRSSRGSFTPVCVCVCSCVQSRV